MGLTISRRARSASELELEGVTQPRLDVEIYTPYRGVVRPNPNLSKNDLGIWLGERVKSPDMKEVTSVVNPTTVERLSVKLNTTRSHGDENIEFKKNEDLLFDR